MNILFVCTGNTCRSAMAEELLRVMARQLDLAGIEAHSAGTDAEQGMPASYGACTAVLGKGGDLFHHAASPLSRAKIEDADLVLTMSAAHKSRVLALCPDAAEKVYTLIGYATGRDEDIEDPFGGDSDVYARALRRIELSLLMLLIKLYPDQAQRIRDAYRPES